MVEAALAHTIRDKAEAAYARSDLLEKRRPLMDAWAEHCARPPAEVVQLVDRARRAEAEQPLGTSSSAVRQQRVAIGRTGSYPWSDGDARLG